MFLLLFQAVKLKMFQSWVIEAKRYFKMGVDFEIEVDFGV